ncbi:La-related protein like [Actinidia chinensis var. chinensis]|uniref:La-related protein like n=1 Tax=Actinidia chinensis var. chinensis TaxID=1590841 RepID=A0A2R6PZK2_ACTCC|nr:La-related protein like [Actinidia chinensis var. chinensis]
MESGNTGEKKPAWQTPTNVVVENGPVISESTPESSNSSSADASVSTSQGLVISNSPQNKKHVDNPNFTAFLTKPVGHRSSKRGGGGGAGLVQSFLSFSPPQQLLPPWYPLYEMPYGPFAGAAPPFSLGGHNNWEGRPIGGFGSQPQSVNDRSSQHNPSQRDNRRDQHRDWNAFQSSNARDVNVHQQMAPPRGFTPPSTPSVTNPFIRPRSAMPFGKPMGFEMTYPIPSGPTRPWESFGGQPFNAHVSPPMSFPVQGDTLPNLLVNQIEYYFSDANLIKDEFLRSKMDHEGWVPIDLIAGFPRVREMTMNIELILNSLRASSIVELKCIQECNKECNKLRRRNDWRRWVCRSGHFSASSSSSSIVPCEELRLANGECVN